MIRKIHLHFSNVKNCTMSKTEAVHIFSITLHDHNYWPYPKLILKQSGYRNRFIPHFITYCMKCVFIFYLQINGSLIPIFVQFRTFSDENDIYILV